jgi:carbamoyl-phosphate synthase large subunit
MNAPVLVLGSGPIRIGQGIEFDYSCVHCVWALQDLGYRAIILNNNPETVSTDFDTGDGLYFEPVTFPDVLKVVEHEKPMGVVCQFGGQTAINLASQLEKAGIAVLGTTPEAIAMAEDRAQFDALLESLNIKRPRGRGVSSLSEAVKVAQEVGYPVLVRPSFVLGGRAMEICQTEDHLRRFYGEAEAANPGQPVLVDQYLSGTEAEVDVISDGEATLVPGIMEHIERAGVHSGDSMAVYPPVSMDASLQAKMVTIACDVARALKVKGLMNIQFVVASNEVYVLEVNPRASRTVPYLSKVTGIPMVDLATRCMMGQTLTSMGYTSGLWEPTGGELQPSERSPKPHANGHVLSESDIRSGRFKFTKPILYAVKAPVFSFQKLSRVEPSLGPEMKSTGEILGVDFTYEAALYKALVASGITFRGKGAVALTVADPDKPRAVEVARELVAAGYRIVATEGTASAIRAAGVEVEVAAKIKQPGDKNLIDLIISGQISLMINTPSGVQASEDSQRIRRVSIECGVPCVTNIDTAGALARALDFFAEPERSSCLRLEEYLVGSA